MPPTLKYFGESITAYTSQGKTDVTFFGDSMENLELILKRALNTLPEGPRELFELSDFLASLHSPHTTQTKSVG